MGKSSANNDQLQNLLNTVSGKLGMKPEDLRKTLESGKIDNAVKNMNTSEQQKIQSIIGDKNKMEKLMQSPQAKALYEKLMGKSPQ